MIGARRCLKEREVAYVAREPFFDLLRYFFVLLMPTGTGFLYPSKSFRGWLYNMLYVKCFSSAQSQINQATSSPTPNSKQTLLHFVMVAELQDTRQDEVEVEPHSSCSVKLDAKARRHAWARLAVQATPHPDRPRSRPVGILAAGETRQDEVVVEPPSRRGADEVSSLV